MASQLNSVNSDFVINLTGTGNELVIQQNGVEKARTVSGSFVDEGNFGKVLQVVGATFSAQGSTSITTADTASNPEIGYTITPKGTNSKFKIDVRWFGEVSDAQDMVAHIHRNGSRINEASTLNYHGLSIPTQTYISGNNDSTPEILTLSTLDQTGSTAGTPIAYKLMFSSSATRTLWTNRCFGTVGNSYETGISEIIITEIGV